MTTDTLYFFYGIEAEYSLKELAKYFRKKGLETIEISSFLGVENFLEDTSVIAERKIIFITSWHLYDDKMNFSIYNPHYPKSTIISPLELMDILQPEQSYFYPHDLVDLFVPHEARWFDLFDGVFFPFKNNDYYLLKSITKTYDVGWIKKSKTQYSSSPNSNRILFLPSSVNTTISPEEHAQIYKDIYSKCHGVKYHFWEGYNDYSDACKNLGLPILDQSLNIFELIDEYDIIMTNSNSSVLYEAGFSGKSAITYYDPYSLNPHLIDDITPYNWLAKLKYEDVLTYLDDVASGTIVMEKGENKLKPFDYDLVTSVIVK